VQPCNPIHLKWSLLVDFVFLLWFLCEEWWSGISGGRESDHDTEPIGTQVVLRHGAPPVLRAALQPWGLARKNFKWPKHAQSLGPWLFVVVFICFYWRIHINYHGDTWCFFWRLYCGIWATTSLGAFEGFMVSWSIQWDAPLRSHRGGASGTPPHLLKPAPKILPMCLCMFVCMYW